MVEGYHGKTYVAYLDISGFSTMMKNLDSAGQVLDRFFTAIYDFCERYNTTQPKICMIVAFDCAAVFTRNRDKNDKLNGLSKILTFVKQVNRQFIAGTNSQPFMTTCSIAYGDFDYEDRAELADIRKNYIFGRPYLNAVLDQKKGNPKIKAGECRLLTKVMPRSRLFGNNSLFAFVLKRGNRRYFYWMLDEPGLRSDFERDYLAAYRSKKSERYSKMVQVLQRYVNSGT